ncbi:HFL251Cp [Eremothecium sinecaudum]|uniref:HFL251Cp n=1 Tax=Eremothecium sinecaudum TaxID=45286 RepID=A0A0X8HUE0_9SACH|nr:HFL251Cp [Eremothecium sinecaudum]AMD21605.1 HFL251Cp [Eremothecium sinecaudum]
MVFLPQSFFGFPLYIGVELSLGIAIFNKFCGFYGILALFTGHPLRITQWFFYVWSCVVLLVYLKGISQIYKPTLPTTCLVLMSYSADTILSCIFTIYFTNYWFSKEGSAAVADVETANQPSSASQSYEYNGTLVFTLFTLAARFYSNFLIAAFVQRMMKQDRFIPDDNDIDLNLKSKPVLHRAYLKLQRSCYHFCRYYLLPA